MTYNEQQQEGLLTNTLEYQNGQLQNYVTTDRQQLLEPALVMLL